jgi:hypothetical protein
MIVGRTDQVPDPDLGGRDGFITSGILPVRIGRDGIGKMPSAEHLREQPAQPNEISRTIKKAATTTETSKTSAMSLLKVSVAAQPR